MQLRSVGGGATIGTALQQSVSKCKCVSLVFARRRHYGTKRSTGCANKNNPL